MGYEAIRFKCARNNDQGTGMGFGFGNKKRLNWQDVSLIRYFTGTSNDFPYTDSYYWSSDIHDCDPVDGKLSENDVEFESRTFKNVFIGNDGLNYTFTNESMQCFGPEGHWNWFSLEVWV